MNKKSDQLCWSCKKSGFGLESECPWEKSFDSIPGWDATRRDVNGNESYEIRSCPLYEKEKRVKEDEIMKCGYDTSIKCVGRYCYKYETCEFVFNQVNKSKEFKGKKNLPIYNCIRCKSKTKHICSYNMNGINVQYRDCPKCGLKVKIINYSKIQIRKKEI